MLWRRLQEGKRRPHCSRERSCNHAWHAEGTVWAGGERTGELEGRGLESWRGGPVLGFSIMKLAAEILLSVT